MTWRVLYNYFVTAQFKLFIDLLFINAIDFYDRIIVQYCLCVWFYLLFSRIASI